MSKDKYRFPKDEFDQIDVTARPVGAHEAPRSTWSRIWPFLVIIVVAPALAFGVIQYLSSDVHKSQENGGAAPSASASATTPATTPSATPTPSVTPTPTPVVDKGTLVTVYNGSGQGGLAQKITDTLSTDGWTNLGPAQTYAQGATEGASTVYYSEASQQASAQAVAQALGITEVKLDPTTAQNGIAVILLIGYQAP